MTDKEALKLALEALETLMIERGSIYEKAITALKEALAEHAMRETQRLGQEIEQEPVVSKWSLREVYFDEDGEPLMHRSPPEQEPVAWADHGVVNWIADKQFKHASLLYTTPPQRTEPLIGCVNHDCAKCKEQQVERNFCSRCGKRTPDLITIHTCTPPKENT